MAKFKKAKRMPGEEQIAQIQDAARIFAIQPVAAERLLTYFNRKWQESVAFLFHYAVALARTLFDAGPVKHSLPPRDSESSLSAKLL